jgi:hypothetical protein
MSQVLQQVEAIGDLQCLWCALHSSLSVETATIAAYNLDRRMLAEPAGGRFC